MFSLQSLVFSPLLQNSCTPPLFSLSTLYLLFNNCFPYSQISYFSYLQLPIVDCADLQHMAHMKSTLQLASSSKSSHSEHTNKDKNSSPSNSQSKLCLALGIDSLSLSKPTATATNKPIAVQDYPPSCNPMPTKEPSIETHYFHRRHFLLCKQEESKDSIGDGQLLASSTSGNEQELSSYHSLPLGQDAIMDFLLNVDSQMGTVCTTLIGNTNITPTPPTTAQITAPSVGELANQIAPPPAPTLP